MRGFIVGFIGGLVLGLIASDFLIPDLRDRLGVLGTEYEKIIEYLRVKYERIIERLHGG